MGFFSKLFKHTKDLNKVTGAAELAISYLSLYEKGNDFDNLCAAAWIIRVGVLDIIEENNWQPSFNIAITIDGRTTLTTVMMLRKLTYGRVLDFVESLTLMEQNIINSIFNKGKFFYNIESRMPEEVVDKIK